MGMTISTASWRWWDGDGLRQRFSGLLGHVDNRGLPLTVCLTWKMKLQVIFRSIGEWGVAMALLSMGLSAGAAEVIPPMHVQLAPEMKTQIKRMPGTEQVRIQKAIGVANRFMTMRFAHKDYGAHTVAEDSDRWDRQVGSLMSMDVYQWSLIYDREGWSMGYSLSDKKRDSFDLVSCDAATLTDLQPLDGGYALTFRTRLLGIDPHSFNDEFREHYPDESTTYELTVVLNNNLRVKALRTPNKTVAVNVKYLLSAKKNSIGLQKLNWQQRARAQYKTLQSIAKRCESNH